MAEMQTVPKVWHVKEYTTQQLHRKKFRVAWYWNLRFFISEYLQDTQDGVSQEQLSFLKMYQVLFFNATHQVKQL